MFERLKIVRPLLSHVLCFQDFRDFEMDLNAIESVGADVSALFGLLNYEA